MGKIAELLEQYNSTANQSCHYSDNAENGDGWKWRFDTCGGLHLHTLTICPLCQYEKVVSVKLHMHKLDHEPNIFGHA